MRSHSVLDDPTFYASGDGPVVGIRDWMGAMGVGGPNSAGGLAAEAMSGAELRANDAIEMHPYDAEEDGIELRNMTQWDSWHANDDEDWVNHVSPLAIRVCPPSLFQSHPFFTPPCRRAGDGHQRGRDVHHPRQGPVCDSPARSQAR